MNIREIERQIVTKVLSHHQDFERAILRIFNYTFSEITSFSFPLQYFKNGSVLDLPANINISDDIKLLLSVMFKEDKKSNKGTLTIYPDGSYESEFIWDEQADLENLMLAVWQTIDYWGNNILFDYLCSVYPDWQKAVIKSYIKGDKVIFQLISLSEQDVLINIDIPEDIQADYIAWQEYCINGKLKSLFTTPWNGIIFNLNISKDFFGKLDSNFIFEGNS